MHPEATGEVQKAHLAQQGKVNIMLQVTCCTRGCVVKLEGSSHLQDRNDAEKVISPRGVMS